MSTVVPAGILPLLPTPDSFGQDLNKQAKGKECILKHFEKDIK